MKGKKRNSKKEEARTEEVKTEEVKTEEPKTEQVARDYKKEVEGMLPMVKFKNGEGTEVARLLYANDRSLTVRMKNQDTKVVPFGKIITVASEANSLSFGS